MGERFISRNLTFREEYFEKIKKNIKTQELQNWKKTLNEINSSNQDLK